MKHAGLTEWSIVLAFSVGVGTIVWGLLHALVFLFMAVLS